VADLSFGVDAGKSGIIRPNSAGKTGGQSFPA
jgi:hypothetical protein